MADDFEKRIGEAYRSLGPWQPPPLDAERRKRLLALRGAAPAPFLEVVWNAAREAGRKALAIVDMAGMVLSPAAPAPLLRGGGGEAAAKVLECKLAGGTLRLALVPGGGEKLRLMVSLLGGDAKGNYSVELAAGGDTLESRPLRHTAELSLRTGGVYNVAVFNGDEEIGAIALRLDKESDEVSP